jgi:DNA-binding CsgD family transcriptional regulator
MLFGRQAEIALVDDLLQAAREGTSSALVVRGDPGIGKTALLEYAAERADGFLVIRVVGVETEAELAYAALHQLVRPLADRLERLPEPQAAAVRTALGLSAGGEVDPFLIGVAMLTLLAEASDAQPVLCLLDDAQWFDRASVEAVGFSARRLHAEAVVLLLGVREGEAQVFELPAIEEMRLLPLVEADSHALLASGFGAQITSEARKSVVESAAGNPLALLEFAASAASEGRQPSAGPRDGSSVEKTYAERIGHLPAAAQQLLVLAAAGSSPHLSELGRAAQALDLQVAALEPAERDGLIWVADGRILFRHPLVRSAAYRAATFAQRQSAHAAWANSLVSPADADRRAWHLASAASGPDEAVAAELEKTAERARARSGHAAAAAALERAAELSPDDDKRARRLVGAASAAWNAGRVAPARLLVDEAEPLATDPRLRAELLFVRGSIELTLGRPADANRLLLDAVAEAAAAGDIARAMELLPLATHAAGISGDMAAVVHAVDRLRTLGDTPPGPARSLLVGIGALLTGDPEAGISALRETIARVSDLGDPRALATWGAASAVFLGQDAQAIALLSRAIALARARGAIAPLSFAIERRAYLLAWQGRAAEAHIDAEEGLNLAVETGLENSAAQDRAVLALVAALRGDEATARGEADRALAIAEKRGLAHVWGTATWALALIDLGAGHFEAAARRLDGLSEPRPGRVHPWFAVRCIPDLVEAAARCGRAAAAKEPLQRFAAWTEQFDASWARPLVARCHGLLAEGDEAERRLLEALRLHQEGDSPFQRARTQLCLGEVLRRGRKRVEAREHLRAALEAFEHMGAQPWAARAHAELRASGESARRRDPSTLSQLTPQELQIARLVGEGAINRDVAAQLFLSPKTVEYHLHKVFQKLDITSRTELMTLTASAQPAPVATAAV